MEFHELQQIVESNSRAIQAMLEAQAEARLEREELREAIVQVAQQAAEERAELRQAMIGVANRSAEAHGRSLLSSLDSDRPTVLRKLNTIENKVNKILERGDG